MFDGRWMLLTDWMARDNPQLQAKAAASRVHSIRFATAGTCGIYAVLLGFEVWVFVSCAANP
jgi:hypothetical protein